MLLKQDAKYKLYTDLNIGQTIPFLWSLLNEEVFSYSLKTNEIDKSNACLVDIRPNRIVHKRGMRKLRCRNIEKNMRKKCPSLSKFISLRTWGKNLRRHWCLQLVSRVISLKISFTRGQIYWPGDISLLSLRNWFWFSVMCL